MRIFKALHKIPFYARTVCYIKSFSAYRQDIKRVQKRLLQEYNGLSEDAMDYKFFLLSHSIEKIFTHIDGFRYRSSQRNIKELMATIVRYEDKEYNKSRSGYNLAINSLRYYYQKHLDANITIDEIKQFLENRKTTNLLVGIKKFNRTATLQDKLTRHSVRNFTNKRIKKQSLDKAITEASLSPSSCNRQTYKCHYTDNPKIIEQLLAAQGGLNNYNLPPMLCVISTNIDGYQFVDERNLGYVDGGIFTANLILSLRKNSIEACPLHTAVPKKRYRQICHLMQISADSQMLIAILAIGYPAEGEQTPISHRRNLTEISRKV